MSSAANRRILLETVNDLVKARAPTAEQLNAVYMALAQVSTDLIGENCQVILRIDEAPKSEASSEGASGG